MYNGRDFFNFLYSEAVAQTCSVKKVFLEILQNSQESICARVSFLIKLQALPASLLKKRLAQVFSFEFCKISKNIFFYRTPLVAASIYSTIPISCISESCI